MAELKEQAQPYEGEASNFFRVVDILGGTKVLGRKLKNPLDAHELLLRGLPSATLTHAIGRLASLHDPASLEKAIGVSWRTVQRRKADPARRFNKEQSSRIWKFAEILAKATAVFGSREAAEEWLERPAIGLEQRRPIDLLSTAAGIEIVETHLGRLEYCVYT
jgi:putative toxin-antitoxin system antitoxin component (TIGR02293 family)